MRRPKVYISGPISGLRREVYLARFAEAERWLRQRGYQVKNPCRLAPCRWPWLYRIIGYRFTLWYDILHLSFCDRIVYLPGWHDSRGAAVEYYWATFRFGITNIFCEDEFNAHMIQFIENYGKEKQE